MAEHETPTPKRPRRIGAIVLGIVVAFVAVGALALFVSHRVGPLLFALVGCKEDIVTEIPSPDGNLKAVLSIRDCGATTRASTHVNIIRRTSVPPGPNSSEVFAGYEVPWNAATHKIGAEWKGNNSLKVWYADDVELTHLNNYVHNVHVQFQLRR